MGEQFMTQLIGVAVTAVWSGVLTWVLLKLVDAVVGMRVASDEETEGLDTVRAQREGLQPVGMERRGFIKFCAASAAAIGAPAVAADARVQLYSRARLVDEKGQPLRAAAIPVNRNLIFHYPFAATPCFLLNLGKAVKPTQLKTVAGAAYEWKGGIGASALGGRLLGDLRAPAVLSRPRTSASSASAPRRARATASPT